MLFIIGLGLGDPKDISVRGLEIVRSCSRVYLESYTSILFVNTAELEKFYGRSVVLADRDLVEQGVDEILNSALKEDVAFLVAGDPFAATTHSDLLLRAKEKHVEYKILHNASIMSAVACCGLQLYRFGETVSIVMWTDSWKPESFFDKIEANLKHNLHTLCLLDIKVKEQSIENLMKGNKIYEAAKYQTIPEACSILLQIIDNRNKNGTATLLTTDTISVGFARVGSDTQCVVSSSLANIAMFDFGPPLHCLVIAAELHPVEKEMLATFKTP